MADEKEKEVLEERDAHEGGEQKPIAEESAEEGGVRAEADRLKADLEAKEKLLAESVDRIKRLHADFDNFRRRTRQEKEELSAVVAQELIKDLLPLLDNFERALAADLSDESSTLKEGVEMIYKQMFSILEKNGLEKIAAEGEMFDPNFHEAIMRVADESKADDTIVEVLQTGYCVRGRVIRPSMVKVVGN